MRRLGSACCWATIWRRSALAPARASKSPKTQGTTSGPESTRSDISARRAIQCPGLHQFEQPRRRIGWERHHFLQSGPLHLAGTAAAVPRAGRSLEACQGSGQSQTRRGSAVVGGASRTHYPERMETLTMRDKSSYRACSSNAREPVFGSFHSSKRGARRFKHIAWFSSAFCKALFNNGRF